MQKPIKNRQILSDSKSVFFFPANFVAVCGKNLVIGNRRSSMLEYYSTSYDGKVRFFADVPRGEFDPEIHGKGDGVSSWKVLTESEFVSFVESHGGFLAAKLPQRGRFNAEEKSARSAGVNYPRIYCGGNHPQKLEGLRIETQYIS